MFTAGTFSFYFDGSDVGLSTSSEDIDSLFEFADGTLGISTNGTITLAGLANGGDEDIHRFNGTFGATTSGTWTLYFDGSDVGLTAASDDIDAASAATNGDLLFSTTGTNTTPGNNEDINRYSGSYGPTTSGTNTIELDLSTTGINPAANVDGLHYQATS